MRDHFDHWLAESPAEADRLLTFVIEAAEGHVVMVQGHDAALLPAPPPVVAMATPLADGLPFLFLHAPRSLFAWAPPQARAPPTSV